MKSDREKKDSVTQQMLHGLQRNLLPLGQHISPSEVRNGDLVSVDRNDCVVPLGADLEFAGIADGIGQEQGVWKCSTVLQGTISVPISDLSPDTTLDSPIFAVRRGNDTSFNLHGLGTPIGTVVGIETIGIVQINVGGDQTGKETHT